MEMPFPQLNKKAVDTFIEKHRQSFIEIPARYLTTGQAIYPVSIMMHPIPKGEGDIRVSFTDGRTVRATQNGFCDF